MARQHRARRRDLTGWELDGRFIIEERLGEGGMGTVYRASDRKSGDLVAIKVLKRQLSTNAEHIERFHREAKAMMALNSPYITKVYELCAREQQRVFLVMELLTGRLLRSVIRDGPVAPKLAVAIAGQVAAGLQVAHSVGLIHRDLKPSNIMLNDETGKTRVKLLDFGLVKAVDGMSHLTQPGIVVGTAEYVSPEQAMDQELGPASDIYALACIIYEMLVGWPVFRADNPIDVMTKHVKQIPARLNTICPFPVPDRLDRLVAVCLSKDPADRPTSARSVQQHLGACLLEIRKQEAAA